MCLNYDLVWINQSFFFEKNIYKFIYLWFKLNKHNKCINKTHFRLSNTQGAAKHQNQENLQYASCKKTNLYRSSKNWEKWLWILNPYVIMISINSMMNKKEKSKALDLKEEKLNNNNSTLMIFCNYQEQVSWTIMRRVTCKKEFSQEWFLKKN